MRGLAASALLIAAGQLGVAAATEAVDLELVLAIDVSRSIDADEAQLQRDGYIAAFRNPRILQAIQSGYAGRIAVTYFEWSSYEHSRSVVDWTVIHDPATAEAFVNALATMPIEIGQRTSVTWAIEHAMPLFAANAVDGRRRVIDISGDGPNNSGPLVTLARDRAVATGIVINGLPIVNDRASPGGWPSMPNLDLYYENCVIGGPGSFVVVADTFKDFASAILKKLILEIAGIVPTRRPATASAPAADSAFSPALANRAVASSRPRIGLAPPPGRPLRPVADRRERIVPPCDAGERQIRDRFFQ